jgi:hypothetical protein
MTTNQSPPIQAEVDKAKRIRKSILLSLYRFFIKAPYAELELSQLAEQCDAEPAEMNWNIVYLEKCGLVTLGRSSDCPPYVSCTVNITAAGVDLVETPGGLDEKFE